MDGITDISTQQLVETWSRGQYHGPKQDLEEWTGPYTSEAPGKPLHESTATSPEAYIRSMMTGSEPLVLLLALYEGLVQFPSELALVIRLYNETLGIQPGWEGSLNSSPEGLKAKIVDLLAQTIEHEIHSLDLMLRVQEAETQAMIAALSARFEIVCKIADTNQERGEELADLMYHILSVIGYVLGEEHQIPSSFDSSDLNTKTDLLKKWLREHLSAEAIPFSDFSYCSSVHLACTQHTVVEKTLGDSETVRGVLTTAETFEDWLTALVQIALAEGFEGEVPTVPSQLNMDLPPGVDVRKLADIAWDNPVAEALLLQVFFAHFENKICETISTFEPSTSPLKVFAELLKKLNTLTNAVLLVCQLYKTQDSVSEQAQQALCHCGLSKLTQAVWNQYHTVVIPHLPPMTLHACNFMAQQMDLSLATFSSAPPLAIIEMLALAHPLTLVIYLEVICKNPEGSLKLGEGVLPGFDSNIQLTQPRSTFLTAIVGLARLGFGSPLQALLEHIEVQTNDRWKVERFRIVSTPPETNQATLQNLTYLRINEKNRIEDKVPSLSRHCAQAVQGVLDAMASRFVPFAVKE